MKVLTFSKQFPKDHPKEGQQTHFVQKVLHSLLPDSYEPATGIGWPAKLHTIRAGNRWKVGDMASLRVWSDKPYRSKQVEFAQVEIMKIWPVTIIIDDIFNPICSGDKVLPAGLIARNDGLETDDFTNWFKIHPKKAGAIFTGQIICWSDKVEYNTQSLTETTVS